MNLSKNSFSINSYGIFSLLDIVYNVDKINLNFLSIDEDENPVDYIEVEKFEINQFKSEEEFSVIEKKISTTNNNNKNIVIKISNDNECFEPEINQYDISIKKIEEEIKSEENEFDIDENIIEEQIIIRVNELKENIEKNFENNTIYEAPSYNIYFYYTSKPSQNNAILNESVSNVNLMKCEKKLKQKYNIPDSEALNIIKVYIKRKETNSYKWNMKYIQKNLNF